VSVVDVRAPIQVTEWPDSYAWDAFVESHPASTIAHRWAWKEIVERSYRHRSFYLGATSRARLRGVLPLFLIRSRVLGNQLVSMPFLDSGGPCAVDASIEDALVAHALEIARRENATLELRCIDERMFDLSCSLDKATMELTLGSDEQSLWKRLPSERRNRINKGRREGLTTTVGGGELLDEFYRVFAVNMRDLGSPVHGLGFFHQMMARLRDRTRVIIVHADGRAIGGGVMVLDRAAVSIPWVSSLREFFARCPNQILYWEAMRFAIENGFETLDFGRSTKGSGTFEAKRQWGAEARQLHWYFSGGDARPSATVGGMDWAGRLWRRLPLPVANAVGPRVRRSISN
jgi:FemAB-related protein (PEP-CTERM system-associated)